MPYEILIDHEVKVVRVVPAGSLLRSEGAEIITAARQSAAKHHFPILYDMRNARTLVPLSEWFHLPRDLEVLRNPATRRVRVAILASVDERDAYSFYETVATNVGLSVRVFLDEDEAVRWLGEHH